MAGFGSKTQGLFNAPKGSQVTRQSQCVVFQQVEEYLRLGWTPAEPYKVLSFAHPGGQAMRLQNSPGQIHPSTAMEGCAGAIRAGVRPRPLEPRPEPGQLHASLRGETFAATRNNARSARKRRRPVTHRCASRCCAVSRSGSRHRREPSETLHATQKRIQPETDGRREVVPGRPDRDEVLVLGGQARVAPGRERRG